ncbi:MAG: hypothetical protein A2Y36_13310 [Treponema sp. GWA1_62_8]|nr:MAG: hypothetical protein A2Y36_13310 [Treponema sp. GWA1_62_8]
MGMSLQRLVQDESVSDLARTVRRLPVKTSSALIQAQVRSPASGKVVAGVISSLPSGSVRVNSLLVEL